MPDTTTKVFVSTAAISHWTSGPAIAAGAVGTGTPDNSIGTAQHGLYPRADVVVTFNHTGSISSLSNFITLIRRDLNIDGTNDEPPITNALAAATTAPSYYFGKGVAAALVAAQSINGGTYTQTVQFNDIPLPAGDCEFSIHNNTNQSLSAGWTLKVIPKTDVAA